MDYIFIIGLGRFYKLYSSKQRAAQSQMYGAQQRKVIQIFKSFIERIFVPQLAKMDPVCQQEWTKFSAIISKQPANLNQMQLYVDTLPTFSSANGFASLGRQEIKSPPSPLFSIARKETAGTDGGFNPLKTFGGQKSKAMFPLKDFDDSPSDRPNYSFSKDFSKDKQEFTGLTTQAILPNLERLFKVFNDNQMKIEKTGYTGQSLSYEPKTYYN